MTRVASRFRRGARSFFARLTIVLMLAQSVRADDTLVLKDGRELVGRVDMVTSLAENPMAAPPADAIRPIVLVDNQLTRTFIPKLQLQQARPGVNANVTPPIIIKQPVAESGNRIASVGPILRREQYDQFGRGILTMKTDNKEGKLDVVMGITAVTPLWTRVESLRRPGAQQIIWDMRIATSSIPRETLSRLLANHLNRKQPDQRLKIVRLYLDSERYSDAEAELRGVIADFPELKNLDAELKSIRQLGARRILQEIEMRQAAGQHRLAYALLEKFPTQDVAGAIQEQARAMLEKYREQVATIQRVKKDLAMHLAAFTDANLRERIGPAVEELSAEISVNTLPRLADYLRLAGAPGTDAPDKVALAVTGWLLGPDEAVANASLAVSAYVTRNLIRDYLREPQDLKRADILSVMQSQEAATPRYVAKIISQMKPPLETKAQEEPDRGLYSLSVAGLPGERDVTYHAQLPPEYDPYRRYPLVVTLNGAGSTPVQQLDWWAGERPEKGLRLGQATRHGYIVISVDWIQRGQVDYLYSAREHAAVLSALRDACRRFAVNTDRVFLSGHSMGGDAAWDIGLAHPDLWAGVIPIVAKSDRFVAHYSLNAPYVPWYFVGGEYDGDKLFRNARDLDRYMIKPNANVTVVEYLGRGHEHFYEEIQNLFAWMGRHERNFFPKEFGVSSMRSFDNYFWWLELADVPENTLANPADWPPPRGTRAMTTKASILVAGNAQTVNVQTGATKITVWLAPDLVDFNKRIRVTVKGRPVFGVLPAPELRVLLEDVRTRGDRLHPFWARVDLGAGVPRAAKK